MLGCVVVLGRSAARRCRHRASHQRGIDCYQRTNRPLPASLLGRRFCGPFIIARLHIGFHRCQVPETLVSTSAGLTILGLLSVSNLASRAMSTVAARSAVTLHVVSRM